MIEETWLNFEVKGLKVKAIYISLYCEQDDSIFDFDVIKTDWFDCPICGIDTHVDDSVIYNDETICIDCFLTNAED